MGVDKLTWGESVHEVAVIGPARISVYSRGMKDLTSEDLRRAVTVVATTLAPHVAADWSLNAGDLEWTCRQTLDHSVHAVLWYAANLATLSTEPRQHVRYGDPNGPIARLLDALVSGGHILARVAEATPPGGVGYHGDGMADATGFLAMGCDEVLVHANDICLGLGVEFRPPDDVCERLVPRLFPWAPECDDPWARLLWCNGRLAVLDRSRLGPRWSWWCAPLAEWDGVPRTVR